MAKNIKVSIIIVSFNTSELTVSCIKSIKKNVKCAFEIIVVDNNSSDDSVSELSKLKKWVPEIHIIKNKINLGFAKACNIGIREAKGDYVLLLNSDTLLLEDSVTPCIKFLENHNEVGILSCKLLNKDMTLQPTGGFFPTLPRVFMWMYGLDDLPLFNSFFSSIHPKPKFYDKSKIIDWVTGAFFLVRSEVFDKVGQLDEDYFMYVEELDLCYRAKNKGFLSYYLDTTGIIHYGGASAPSNFAIENEIKNQILFFKKHKSTLERFVVRTLFKSGVLLRGVVYAILGKQNDKKIYLKLWRTL